MLRVSNHSGIPFSRIISKKVSEAVSSDTEDFYENLQKNLA